MIRSVFQNASPLVKLIFIFFVMVLSFLVTFIVGMLIAMPFMEISLADITTIASDLSNEENIRILKFIQGLNTFGLFVVPPFLIAFLSGEKASAFLNLKMHNAAVTAFLVIVIMLAALPFVNFLAEINSNFGLPDFLSGLEQKMKNAEENAQRITEEFVNVCTFSGYLANVLVIAILPAIGEEFIFRGVFQKLFIQWTRNNHLGIILAAILFSAFHFQFFGFIPRMLMGVFFGYLVIWTKSIWLPVIGHFVNNVTAVTFYYLYNIDVVKVDLENIGAGSNETVTVIISTIMVFALIYSIYIVERNKRRMRY